MQNFDVVLSRLNSGFTAVTSQVVNKYFFGDEPDDWIVNSPDFDYVGYGDVAFVQADGKVIAAGRSGLYDGGDNYSLVKRFNADGRLDETFSSPKFMGNYDGFIRDVKQQSDGKLIVVGHFDEVNGNSHGHIIRLNVDGTIDNTFASGSGFNNNCLCVDIMSDDSVIVGGTFSNYDGTSVNRVVKLGSDGALDSTFDGNVSIGNNVYAVKVASGDKVFVGYDYNLIKLNSDGTTDGGFSNLGFNDRVSSIAIQEDGKVLVGGWFDYYDGSPCNPGVVRLDSDGSLDGSFSSDGTGLNYTWEGNVQAIALQPNGKVVVGGWFTTYNSTVQKRIARLNSDGTRDTTFVVGAGFNDRVQDIAVDSSGNIYCAGFFTQYNNKNLSAFFNYGNTKISFGFAKLASNGQIFGPSLPFDFQRFGIGDGGEDLYDGGCYFNTNLTQTFEDIVDSGLNGTDSIPWTHSNLMISDASDLDYVIYDSQIDYSKYIYCPKDGKIRNGSEYFGGGSSYFTNMYPGMAVLGASNMNVSQFSISGGTGQDGDGDYSNGSFEVTVKGQTWACFFKTCYGNDSEPSINHLILVNGKTTGITQEFNDPTDSDDHALLGLTGRRDLFAIVFSKQNYSEVDEETFRQMAVMFLLTVLPAQVITSCSPVFCSKPAFKCLLSRSAGSTSKACTCSTWRYFTAQCTRRQAALGICSTTSGAYVPAITVCNQNLF